MNKIFNILLVAALAVMGASCNGDDPVGKFEAEFPAAASYVYSVDATDGDAVIADGCYMKYTFMTDGKADFRMENVKYDGTNLMMVEFKNQSWTVDRTGTKTITLPSVMATAGGRMVSVTNFKMTCLDRYLGEKYIPVITVSMVVDGNYRVKVIQRSMIAFGETTVTTKATGDKFQTKLTYYQVFLDKTDMKADITIHDPKFAANMPAMSHIVIPDVPFTLGENGYELAIDEVVPNQSNGAPNPRFKITDLECEGVYGAAMDLDCTVGGTYDLSAVLSENGVLPE